MTEPIVRVLSRLLSVISRVGRGRNDPPEPGTVRRIVVFQMSGLGDLVLITPALRALRRRYPHAKIDVITYSLENAAFLFRLPNMGEGCAFPLFALELNRMWSPAFWRILGAPIRFIRAEPCDLYVSFHHTWLPHWFLLELWIAARSEARFRIGINPDCIAGPGVFDRSVPESLLGTRHYRHFFLDVVRLLGDVGKDLATEFPLEPREREEARARIRLAMPGRDRIACFHVGASHSSQIWPVERFTELAKRLEAKGCGIVFIGSARERSVIAAITAGLPQGSHLDTAGTTSLFQMAALIDVSDVFVGNDSGPMHVAIARGRPTIGLIGPGKPRYYRYEPGEAVILRDPAPSPSSDALACKDALWHWEISVDEVFAQTMRLLA